MPRKDQRLTKRNRRAASKEAKPRKSAVEKEEEAIANDPAVERGERIMTGKTIARGGQHSGHVPGATESSPKKPRQGRG